ncbi:MAG: response regulator [Candidatus Omnitrophica bacterium]|nr:response regulator [Candidatus Omnitrophota bacterium]
MKREKIVTIDDDPDILDVLELTLSENYDVFQAPNGLEGLKMVQQKLPDLVVCDYMMPVMNGIDFCKEMKKDILLQHIPVIMLTGKGEAQDQIKGIQAGADDYLVKPFAPDILIAKIQMILRRTVRSLDANPLTHLPGNTSIMEELQANIDKKITFAVGYADLDKFKAYNDKYGFEKGDEVIKATARTIIKNVREIGGLNTFVGHIGGDDFVFVAADEPTDKICEGIIKDFDALVPGFYTDDDRGSGFIIAKNRQGEYQQFSLLAISIAVVSNKYQPITHVAQIAELGADLKKYAKTFDKSNYVRDRRI